MRDRGLFLIVLFLALLRLVDLDFAEVQGWDEALYAIRARSILQFGDWLDQSAHSVGGLYSAAHPPLYVWLTAILMKIFGESPTTVRFWSAVAGAVTVLAVYYLPKDRLTGFFSAVTLGTCSFFTFYSRQGQLDVIYTCFIMLGLFFFMKYESTGKRRLLWFTGISCGLALMSKIIVGLFLPMILGVYMILKVLKGEGDTKSILRGWLTVFGVGLIIAAPWHIFMIWKHGSAFTDSYVVFHIIARSLHGVELNVRALGPLFFANQIIVILPVGSVFLIRLAGRIRSQKEDLLPLSFAAFLVPFLIFTLSRTQLRTYAIPMLPPLALVAGCGFRDIWRENRVSKVLIILFVVFSIWASSQTLRDQTKEFFRSGHPSPALLLAAGAAVILILSAGRRMTGRVFTIIVLCTLFVFSFIPPIRYSQSGIARVGSRFEKDTCRTLIYMDEVRTVHNPQISYYFHGVDIGWRDGYRFELITPEDAGEFSLPMDTGDCAYIIISRQYQHEVFDEIEKELESDERSEEVLLNDRYHVFRLGK